MKKINSQSGQATLELAAILTGIIAMAVGFLFVAGLSLSDNRTLLRAKANSEWGARNGGATNSSDQEMAGWSYGETTVGGNTVTVPFSSLDTPSWRSFSTQLDSTVTGLSSSEYSYGQENGIYQYRWMSPSVFDTGYQSDFSSTLSNGYNAARLYHGSDDSVGPVFGFDESGLWTGGAYVDNRTTRNRTRTGMRNTFHQWFGVKISESQLAESPANQVYMPAGNAADEN